MKHILTVMGRTACYLSLFAACITMLIFTGIGAAYVFRGSPALYIHPVMEYPNEQYILVGGTVPDTVYVIRWIDRDGKVSGLSAYSKAERDEALRFLRGGR